MSRLFLEVAAKRLKQTLLSKLNFAPSFVVKPKKPDLVKSFLLRISGGRARNLLGVCGVSGTGGSTGDLEGTS